MMALLCVRVVVTSAHVALKQMAKRCVRRLLNEAGVAEIVNPLILRGVHILLHI
jgi:hypothetical protein